MRMSPSIPMLVLRRAEREVQVQRRTLSALIVIKKGTIKQIVGLSEAERRERVLE